MEGECHWSSQRPDATSTQPCSAPILSILKDRLRNGVILCDLLLVLESSAARHISLARYGTVHT